MFVASALLAVVAGVTVDRVWTRSATKPRGAIVCPIFVDDARALHDEVRRLSLEACLARVEVDKMKLRAECAAGTASKMACAPGEGQYRMDLCARYRPRSELDHCPFPGACSR